MYLGRFCSIGFRKLGSSTGDRANGWHGEVAENTPPVVWDMFVSAADRKLSLRYGEETGLAFSDCMPISKTEFEVLEVVWVEEVWARGPDLVAYSCLVDCKLLDEVDILLLSLLELLVPEDRMLLRVLDSSLTGERALSLERICLPGARPNELGKLELSDACPGGRDRGGGSEKLVVSESNIGLEKLELVPKRGLRENGSERPVNGDRPGVVWELTLERLEPLCSCIGDRENSSPRDLATGGWWW